jgi:uncharacterized membrane protein (DUF4010 family)
MVALMLGSVALAVGLLQQRFGDAGLAVGVVLAALVDAHAPIASLASLHAAGALDSTTVVTGALLAVSSNTLSRCVVAVVSGGLSYGLRVAAALAAGLGVAWSAGAWVLWR